MRASRFISASILAFAVFAIPSTARAQAQSDQAALRQEIDQLRKEFDALKEQYGNRLAALEAKLSTVSGEPTATLPAPVVPADPAVAASAAQVAASGAKFFNPDMAVIGNFRGAAGKNHVNPQPALEMHESEVSFQAVVDPYARADFFVAIGDEGAELEEGFITFPTLPGGLLMKVGKMKAAFGKINSLHPHVLPWTDRPLASENLVGGEEGFSDAGVSVARLIPNPWTFLEFTGQVFRGESGDLFQSSKRGDLSYVGHLRGYGDITESSNIDLGVSYARGHNNSGSFDEMDDAHFTTELYGLDATFRWKPLRRAIYNSFLGRSEVFWSRREQPGGLQKALGFYVSGDYQFARRWTAGARYDRSNRADDALLLDRGHSLLLTYRPSEFSLVRSQYRRTRFEIGEPANEFLIQFLYAIGAHGAHPF